MVHEKIWNRSDLRWIWTYELAATIGAAYPVLAQYFRVYPNLDLLSALQLCGVFRLLYLSLLSVEATSLHFVEAPPWYVAILQSSRFAITSVDLYGSLLRFSHSLAAQDGAVARLFTSSIQDLVVFTLWWLASYNGLVHTIAVWALCRARAKHSGTLSQFGFRSALRLWPIHLTEWTCMHNSSQPRNLVWRIFSYAPRIFRATFGSLGLWLCLATRSGLLGEPRVRVLTFRGFPIVGGGFDKDPEIADYPKVRNDETESRRPASSENGSRRLSFRPRDARSSHSLRSLSILDAQDTEQSTTHTSLVRRGTSNAPTRRLRPRYLCMVDEAEERGYRVVSTEENNLDSVQYVFVSYTRLHFSTNIQGDAASYISASTSSTNLNCTDSQILISMAIHAASQVGVKAFWIDFECLRPDKPEDLGASRNIGDVYQICDIVRGSYCMAIAVGPPFDDRCEDGASDVSAPARRAWLRQYGDRLWTLPEALLCPSNHGILLYSATQDGFETEQIEKRNLAERIWFDAESTRGLLEHYEGSVTLTQIEFISLALQCLQRRKTVTRMPADFIYALMGLLRARIPVHETQSTFEAFAHLSLANDSQKLLERLFCMLSIDANNEWHDMSDLWDANIRDIVPTCEITGVAAHDTVQIARMYGSVIHWAPLPAVEFELARPSTLGLLWTWQRTELAAAFSVFVVMWICALMHLAITATMLELRPDLPSRGSYVALNAQLLLLMIPAALSTLSACLLLPSSLHRLYGGDIKFVQARFFGFHGIADLGAVEETLFGRNCGRMAWSKLNPQESLSDCEGTSRWMTYTLVDTWLMTASTFQASTRPSIVAIPGKHRGALRAMLCSFDKDAGVYYREQVLRMNEKVLDRMSTMDTARFSLHPQTVFRDDELTVVDDSSSSVGS